MCAIGHILHVARQRGGADEEMGEEMEHVKLLCFKEAMRNVGAGMALEGLLLASAP